MNYLYRGIITYFRIMCEISTGESRLPAIHIGYCAMLTIELRTDFLGIIDTCPRNQVKSAFIRQSHLRQQIAVIGFTGKAIRHHVAVAFEELHELRHGVDEDQRHVRLNSRFAHF
jgi:hypothetical protein